MATNEIETHIFGRNNAHFLQAFDMYDGQVKLDFTPMEQGIAPGSVTATFTNSAEESAEHDDAEPVDWPLDIIGFDFYEIKDRWRFVLNCGAIEWSWISDWAMVKRIQNSGGPMV